MPDYCPHCKEKLRDENDRYIALGRYDWILDRTVSWICPHCEGEWPADDK